MRLIQKNSLFGKLGFVYMYISYRYRGDYHIAQVIVRPERIGATRNVCNLGLHNGYF
jgi:3-methyladenine DNA glycosylase Mpg